ncbi:hypothetical protein EAH88_11875 [Rhodanobacter glycinis]|uniref:Uncharacterized protein n=1 Tax=Rhodanobacter glycinis TaxID=582702 RepID=A0A502C696_9GAMM|nr:hypothetical protein [Rhodanobacter glycinis]TPG08322.1 hypothetical protein EAH88_11875 [Rhodanobacter glycinis]
MSSGGNSAAKAANDAEAQRQSAIAGTQSRVNQVFNDPQRQADINDFVGATRSYYQQDLDRQKGNADRGLKFALAKSGLTGGSTQVDQQQQLGQDYGRGLLQVEQKAQGAGASLSAADQDARSRLISLATSGLDATTAAQQAGAAMRSNLQAGQSEAQLGNLGDSFGQVNSFLTTVKNQQQFQKGYLDGTPGGKRVTLYGGASGGYGG